MTKKFFMLLLTLCLSLPLMAANEVKVSTTQELLDALHGAMATQVSTRPLIIRLTASEYSVTEPISITTSPACPVIVRGDARRQPQLTGGIRVTGWQHYRDNVWRARVQGVDKNHYFEQFFVNGHRATLARTPNVDNLKVENAWENNSTRLVSFVKGALAPLKDITPEQRKQVRFEFFHAWDVSRWVPLTIDIERDQAQFSSKIPWNPGNPVKWTSRCVIYNYPAALDAPGEWYLDRAEGYVYYIPMDGEDMTRAVGYAPMTPELLVIAGKKDSPVKNISFENVTFAYASHIMSAEGEFPHQSANGSEAAVKVSYAEGVKFINCTVTHTGGGAIWLERGCTDCTVEHCLITDIGATGIRVGSQATMDDVARGNVVDNNILCGLSQEIENGAGICLFHARDTRVTHNDISDLNYTGISVGWVWGYNKDGGHTPDTRNVHDFNSPSMGNIISYNHIHHIGWGLLSDMGGVYTLGEQPGTEVTFNVIHDIQAYDYGGWGLYTDEGSSYILMANNLVYRCKHASFHQHYGKDNRIENNILAFGTFYQLQYTRPEPHTSFHFKHNIVLQDQGKTLSGAWLKGKLDMDSNLYWARNGKYDFVKLSFDEWKAQSGHDRHSVIANPMFRDPDHGDFGFTSLEAVRQIGFKPFDVSKAGVYGSKEWVKKAQGDPTLDTRFQAACARRMANTELF